MSYLSEVTADSPVGWYRCKEASGYLQDSSSHALHADEVHGSPTYSQTGPITSEGGDTAILCHSAGPDWWNIPYYASYDIADVWSIECWIKRTGTSSAEQIIVCRDQGFYLGIITNQLFIARTNVAGIAKSTTTITDTTTWHHLVNTKNAGTVKQYIDGRLESSTITLTPGTTRATGNGAANAAPIPTDVVWLGCRLTGKQPERFRGELDELFIADRGLEPQEIVSLMNNNRLPEPSVATAP